MLLVSPKWDATNSQYVIETMPELKKDRRFSMAIEKDTLGSTRFSNTDALHNLTDDIVTMILNQGSSEKWFSKMPSHEQLMKRIRHSFARLAANQENQAVLTTILMTPKLLTLVWTPVVLATVNQAPPLCFEESESESESESEPEIEESSLPPVALTDSNQESHEEYLLTRLRAAKARVETERIRMQYFETTGRMPPDSDSESEDD